MLLKNKIKMSALCTFICLGIFTFAACGKTPEEKTTVSSVSGMVNESSMVTVYDIKNDRIEARADRYQLKQPESIPAATEELMAVFTVPESVAYVGYTVDESSNVIIILNGTAASEEDVVLTKAALVKTLSQIHTINKVIIEISDDGGNIIEKATYTDASFLYLED